MVRRALILKLFEAFSIQRWNDHIRPVLLCEMDKTAHKMIIAYCLSRYQEDAGHAVDWHNLIRGGIFELLRRVVLSDIKSPVYRKIRATNPEVFHQLSRWVYEQLSESVAGTSFQADLREYLTREDSLDAETNHLLTAAHIFASYWEFRIIKQLHQDDLHVHEIEQGMLRDLEPYLDLPGMRKIMTQAPIAAFIDLAGKLRFQIRWSTTPRVPQTSVLGHSMMVACLTYFFSTEIGACPRRIRNNFFGGLMHDLPESVTRDIISPVKRAVPGLSEIISGIEREMVAAEIHPLLEPAWIEELTYLTENEFTSKILTDGRIKLVSSNEISASFNHDSFNPIDGEIIKIADDLAAYVEAFHSIEAGLNTPTLAQGVQGIREKYRGKTIAGINIGSIYADFA